MNREMIIVLDFGGQYNQLIARRVRECNVYCEVHPCTMDLDKIKEMAPKGIIFTLGTWMLQATWTGCMYTGIIRAKAWPPPCATLWKPPVR